MRENFADRRILVTGAAQGLGLGVARRLARAGARVGLVDIDPAVLDRTKEAPFTSRDFAIVKDLADLDAAEYVVDHAVNQSGSINGLVNCAAWSFHKAVSETSKADFDRLVAINQRAPFFLCQRFAAQIRESDPDPCIVNIASVTALSGNRDLAAYSGTKGAIVAMTRALAVEFAPRIRVVSISPGAVRTDFTEQLIQQGVIDPVALVDRLPIKRFIAIEEVAEIVAFLFGPAAGCITGANWICDGGRTA